MAIWPFNRRNKQDQTVPPEVEEYYQSERRERVGMAWLLAVLSLLATVVVVLGLYFGGRWIWNKINNDNDNGTTTTQTETGQEQQPSDEGAGQTSQPPDTNQPTEPDTSTPSGDTSQTSDTSSGGTNQSSGQSTTGQENLADTGPGATAVTFIAITLGGAFVHNLYTRRKLSRN